jgi:hypothetical protein
MVGHSKTLFISAMRFGIYAQPESQAMPLLGLHLAIKQRNYFLREPPIFFQATIILRAFLQRWRRLYNNRNAADGRKSPAFLLRQSAAPH